MVVIIKSTSHAACHQKTFSPRDEVAGIWLTCSGLMASTVNYAILARSSMLVPVQFRYLHIHIGEQDIVCPVRLSTSFSISLSTWASSTCRAVIFGFAFAAFFSCQRLVACQLLYHLLINNRFQFRSDDFPTARTALLSSRFVQRRYCLPEGL